MDQNSEEVNDVPDASVDDEKPAQNSEAPGPSASAPSRPTAEYHTADTSDFRPPDQKSMQIHKLYVDKKFRECKSLIEDIVAKEDERLCEYVMLIRAQIAREEGQLRDSLVWLNRAYNCSPKSSRVLYELGRGYFLLGEHRKSVDFFQRAAELDPNNWRSFFWQALAHYHLDTNGSSGALDKAQETLIACPKMGRSVEILTFVAKISVQRSDMVSAAEAYRRALEIEPENVHVITNLGLLYLKTNSEDKAFACLGKALTFDPAYVPAILAASTVLQNHGDYDVALSKYRVAADKCDYNGSLWNNIGMCFLGKGKLVAAISCLRKANYLCSLDWKILYNLGICYHAMLQFASAYHFMTAALNINPRNSIILMTLAIILSDLDDFDNARKAYSRGLELDPHNFVIRLNFAVFEYRRGRVAEANKWLEGVSVPSANGEQSQFMELEVLASRLRGCLQAEADETLITT